MKILSLLIVLLALFRETRHQFPLVYPSFPVYLANEEFIEPLPELSAQSVPPTEEGVKHDAVGVPETVPDGSGTPVEGIAVNSDVPDSNSKTDAATSPSIAKDEILKEALQTGAEQHRNQDDHLLEAAVNGGSNTTETVGSVKTEQDKVENGSQKASAAGAPGPVKVEPSKDEEPIPSYMEWAQKKQLELNTGGSNGHHGSNGGGSQNNNNNNNPSLGSGSQKIRNGSSNSVSSRNTGIDAKNFASPDCGAKVVQSNVESQNPSGVLSSSHDEYMLNKCDISTWFVVELCEPLTIERISLGNLELFSSSPKEVEFGISDRYPTRDWTKLGPFALPDARAIHPVVLPSTNASTFGKFVKVSVLSHHGTEHYCPISVIRVNGKSEYEVLDSETIHEHEHSKEESALYEESMDDVVVATSEGNSKGGGIKDAVLNILNKAVQSIVRTGSTTTDRSTTEAQELLASRCRSVLQCVPRGPLTHDIYKLISCNSSNLLRFLAANSPWCGWDYCHSEFESKSIGLPWQPEGFYASLFGGPSVLHALCHYLKPQTDGCDPTCLAMNSTAADYANESLIGDNTTLTEGTVLDKAQQETQVTPTPSELDSRGEENVGIPKPDVDIGIGATTLSPLDQQQVEVPSVDNGGSSTPSLSSQLETQLNSPPPVISQSQPSEDSSAVIHQQAQPPQKESAFVRLTNRIKNLERNQSLTASYLEELSKRFKKQNEDNSAIFEANKKSSEDTRIKLLQLDTFYRQELLSLRRNLDDVRERLFNVQLQRSLLVLICLSQTVLLVFCIFWVKRKCAGVEEHLESAATSSTMRKLSRVGLPSDISERRRVSDPSIILSSNPYDQGYELLRKRSNSDTMPSEKAKKIRKRNKKTNIGTGEMKAENASTSASPLKLKDDSKPFHSGDFVFVPPPPKCFPLKPKENIDPLLTKPKSAYIQSMLNGENSTTPNSTGSTVPNSLIVGNPGLPTTLLTKVDSPFTFQSQISSYMEPGVTTSSRFALLASPVRESPSPSPSSVSKGKPFGRFSLTSGSSSAGYQRSGSTESSVSTASTQSDAGSLSVSSRGSTGGVVNGDNLYHPFVNGGGSIPAAATSGTLGKVKPKKVGLKAFMPKLFDR